MIAQPEPDEPDVDERWLDELRAAARSEPLDAAARLAPSIPGFTLVRELERGGQGVVWLARQHEPPRDVALKLLHRRDRANDHARRRFEQEAELAGRLRHPHVVTVHASGCAGGIPWYAMELIDGAPLDVWLREQLPPRRARVALLAKIARAVAHAHQRGVLHRDLKPANVLVDRAGEPHVLDFGVGRPLARSGGDDAAIGKSAHAGSDSGGFLGTLAYAAPEQLGDDPGAVDTRTDVHALGVMLFELVTGALPYDVADGLAAAVECLVHAQPRRPRALDRSIERDLATVIEMAIAKDPARRYATADALADDLERCLRGEPLAARAGEPWIVLRSFVVRRRRAVVAIAAAVAVVVATALVAARGKLEAAQAARTAADVRAMLLDLLAAARPDRMGANAPLPDILEEAARRLDGRLDGVPDVRAELLLAIGETYRRLQRPDDAVPHLQAALVHARAAGAPLAIARVLDLLGTSVLDEDAARAALEEALAIHERELGPTSALAAQSRSALADRLADRRRGPELERAIALQRRALADLRAACGEESLEVAIARQRLGAALATIGAGPKSDAEAEVELRAAVAALEPYTAAEPAQVVRGMHALASFLQVRRRFDEAQRLLERAFAITRERFDGERQIELQRAFARLHFAKGDFASAEAVSRHALADELDRLARERGWVAPRLAGPIARLREGAAPPPWSESFERLRELRGPGSFETAGWMNGIAQLCRAQGRPDEAEALLRDALTIGCRILGDDCPFRARSFELLAELRREREASE